MWKCHLEEIKNLFINNKMSENINDEEVKRFIDSAVVNNLEEVTVVHGVGEGILLKAIRDYLKTDKNVKEFRRGRYGEGENGVTVVRLK